MTIKNEDPDDKSFDIGPIIDVNETLVSIRYFSPIGFLDEDPTLIDWNKITLINFDDRYSNTLSKYLRERKPKKAI